MRETVLAAVVTGGLLIMAGAQGCRPGVLWDQSHIFPPRRLPVASQNTANENITEQDRLLLAELIAKYGSK